MKKKKSVVPWPRMSQQKRRIKRQRPLHKKLLLHPITFFLLLVLGVLFIGLTLPGTADNLVVSAKVSAPLPTDSATITAPHEGDQISSAPITVSGTCPSDGSGGYVKLYRNNIASGVGFCQADNSFEIQTDLFVGTNQLKAQIYNITDDAGPGGTPVTINYQPAARPAAKSAAASLVLTPKINSAGVNTPFFIDSDFQYKGVIVGNSVSFVLDIVGGKPPYTVDIDWGDGDPALHEKSSHFAISHKYSSPGAYKGSYTVKVKITDATGASTAMQLFAIVDKPTIVHSTLSTNQLPPACDGLNPICLSREALSTLKPWMWAVWPTYAVIVLMAVSFWLGEKQELRLVRSKSPLDRRKAR